MLNAQRFSTTWNTSKQDGTAYNTHTAYAHCILHPNRDLFSLPEFVINSN